MSEDKLLDIICNIDNQIKVVVNNLTTLYNKKQSLSEEALNYENIALMLKNFDLIFEKATEEQRKELLHSLIKEIKIIDSQHIWERKASEIILWFDNADIISYTQQENAGEKFSLICDTSHSSLS